MPGDADEPVVGYAAGPEGFVAYATQGQGPPDIVFAGHWGVSIEALPLSPWWRHLARRLSGLGRLITFDKRGTGVSDPLPHSIHAYSNFAPTIEEAVADLRTVLDHLEVDRCVLLSNHTSTPIGIAAAALHPDRIEALVLVDPLPRLLDGSDFDLGYPIEVRDMVVELFRQGWGTGASAMGVPSLAGTDPALLARIERLGCGRGVMTAYWEHLDYDVRPMLGSIQAPALVIAHDSSPIYAPEVAALAASAIPRARGPIAVPGSDLELYARQPPELMEVLEAFVSEVAGASPEPDANRFFSVLLFTDLVDSTQHLHEVGDARWQELLDIHDDTVGRAVEGYGGRVLKNTGDGVLALFDAPGRAVHCACHLSATTAGLGLPMRAGLHAGEVVARGKDVSGIAVHIAARVADLAESGEVLVTRTVKDLVAGAGFGFAERGVHVLKGVDDNWQLFVASAPR